MFYFKKYQKYFLLMQKNKIQNFKLHVRKFWEKFYCKAMHQLGLLICW